VAAAILSQGAAADVTIRPIGNKPSLFMDPPVGEPEPREPEQFIPPQPERVSPRNVRMPRMDEFPIPAQNEMRARRGEAVSDEHPEKRRMSLLQRIASVGLGRRENEDVQPAQKPRETAGQPAAATLPARPTPRAESRPEPVSEYARRPSPQGLDQHGRPAPVHNRSEEDQLDIPAFLRRQAN
jgi:cell division protein FtsZ